MSEKTGKTQPTPVEAHSHAAEILAQAVKGEYQYAKLGLILGVLAIGGGHSRTERCGGSYVVDRKGSGT